MKVMPRASAEVPGNGGVFRVMSAILPDAGFFGLKSLTGYPGRRLPGETYFVVLLFGCETGALRAIMAANRLTGIRTGAAMGLAAKHLSRPDRACSASSAPECRCIPNGGIDGSASDRTRAGVRCRPGEGGGIRPNRGGVQRRRHAGDQPQQAVVGADLVVTITSARAPVFDGAWLQNGMHVTGAGSNAPVKRELDRVTFARSTISWTSGIRSSTRRAICKRRFALARSRQRPFTRNLARSSRAGNPGGRPQGNHAVQVRRMAVEDIATASFVYKQALASNLGTRLELETLAHVPLASRLPGAAR